MDVLTSRIAQNQNASIGRVYTIRISTVVAFSKKVTQIFNYQRSQTNKLQHRKFGITGLKNSLRAIEKYVHCLDYLHFTSRYGFPKLCPNSLIISFSATARMDFLRQNLSALFLIAHISDVEQASDRRHEHSDERNAHKHVCLVHSIQKNPSTMADNERRSSCHHACQFLQ